MDLRQRLRHCRTQAMLSQQQVADHLGISRATVAQWEKGQHRPDSGRYGSIAKLFNVSLEWLMEGTGELPPEQEMKPSSIKRVSADQEEFERPQFKFYLKEWREFMGLRTSRAAKAAALSVRQYEILEANPLHLTILQVTDLAAAIGVRGEQLWSPPPTK